MNSKKRRDKNRRRASRLSDEAWHASEEGNITLAVRIIRRAVELNPGNPLLWHDQGALLCELGDDESAAQAFRAAIELAPDFADAYGSLAAIRARQRSLEQAVSLQREAVRHAPDAARHRDALAAYEALLADMAASQGRGPALLPAGQSGPVESSVKENWPDLAARIDGLRWPDIDAHLSDDGVAHAPGLLSASECESIRQMFLDDRLFAKTVTMNTSRFGEGVYRYFAAPVPPIVDAIRRLFFPHVSDIANGWQTLVESAQRYPANWTDFRDRCTAAGQASPSPLLLSYEPGGFNALHQDIRGAIYFPIQLVIVLSPRASCRDGTDGFTGGEFLLCDEHKRQAIPAGLGDAILFCTAARLVRLTAGYALQPVKHGLSRIESGRRTALGVPFHELK